MSLKGRSCWDVNIRMDDAEKLSLESIGQFVTASEDIRFEAQDRQQLYDWVEQVLVGREYGQLGKAARGLVRRYIEKMSGLSRAQVTRLIALMHRVQAQKARLALWLRLAPLTDGNRSGPRFGVVKKPLTVALVVAQVIQVSY